MNITNGKLGNVKVGGTSLQGRVFTTYSKLIKAFGQPDIGPDEDIDGKVTCEWTMSAEVDGKTVVATIYDWKTYGSTPEYGYDWHVGGEDDRAVLLVNAQLNAINGGQRLIDVVA
jgi:hypothetical protein